MPNNVMAGIKVPWTTQPCILCSASLGTAKVAMAHLRNVYRPYRVLIVCGKCAGTHYSLPHCTHGQMWHGSVTQGEWCPKSFTTKGGLSNHRRRIHVAHYQKPLPHSHPLSGTKKGAVWSAVDTELLRETMVKLSGTRGACRQARKILPGYTVTQIRSKWNSLKRTARTRELLDQLAGEVDLSEMETELPPVPSIKLARVSLMAALQEDKSGWDALSPDKRPKLINQFLRKLVRKLGGQCARAHVCQSTRRAILGSRPPKANKRLR